MIQNRRRAPQACRKRLIFLSRLAKIALRAGFVMQLPRKLIVPTLLLAIGTPLLGACSDSGITLSTPNLLRPDALNFSGQKEVFTLPPPGPQELVSPAGQCAAPAEVASAASVQGGVALQMTECEVVRRAGSPDSVDVGTSQGGERSVVLKYLRGPRAGIYRFAAGRLVSIERAPDAPAPPAKGKKGA